VPLRIDACIPLIDTGGASRLSDLVPRRIEISLRMAKMVPAALQSTL
jgi:hypothetical protein